MTDSVALAVVEAEAVSLGTLRANGPAELIDRATAVATPLARLIEDRKLYSTIQGRKFVRVEGWMTLAAMLGVTPFEVEVAKEDGIYTAVVELRRLSDGVAVSRASAECGSEHPWNKRDLYARRSMAITRATGKAARMGFSWIMALAGYEATPAEEMPHESEPSAADVARLPGAASKWSGHGGKAISDPSIPDSVLQGARTWLETKDATKNADLVAAIDEELDRRRLVVVDAKGAGDDLPF